MIILTKAQVQEFQKLWLDTFNEPITFEEAQRNANDIICLLVLLYES